MNPDTAQPEEQLHRDCAYQPNPGYYDEMVAPEGTMHTHWQPLMEPLEQMGHAGFARRWQEGRRVIHEHVPTLWPPPAADRSTYGAAGTERRTATTASGAIPRPRMHRARLSVALAPPAARYANRVPAAHPPPRRVMLT